MALIAPPASFGGPPIRSPHDVAQYTRLRHLTIPHAWLTWTHAWDVENLDPLAGLQFDQFQTIIQAVMAGMGVALVPRCLVEDKIAAGLVSEPLPEHGLVSNLGYWLCYPESRANIAPLVAFRNWLLTQARPYREPTTTSLAAQQKSRTKLRGSGSDFT